jgi:WD40 repeat protein
VLHQVFAADPIIARYSWPKDQHVDTGCLWTDLDPTGRVLVASGGGGCPTSHLEVADPRTGTVLWSYPTGDVAAASGGGFIGPSWFSADGSEVIAGLYWGPPRSPDVPPPSGVALGVTIWDAHTGGSKKTIDVGPCGGEVTAVSESRLLVWTPLPGPDGRTGCHWTDDGHERVEVVDVSTGSSTVLSGRATWVAGGTLSGDGRYAAFEEVSEAGVPLSVVVSVETGQRVFQLPFDPNSAQYRFARQLDHDGTLLLYGDRPTVVYKIALGPAAAPIAQLPGLGGESGPATFDPTGKTWYQTARDGTLRVWDPGNGQVLSSWPAVGGGRPSVAADGRTVLVEDALAPTAVLLDIGARGDLGQTPTCHGFISAGSLHVRNGIGAFLEGCGDPLGDPDKSFTQVIDVQAGTLLASLPGWQAQDLAISPDGKSFVTQEAKAPSRTGPLMVADLRTGSPVVELQDLCWYDQSMPIETQTECAVYPQTPFPFTTWNVQWSPDGKMIAAVDGRGPYPGGYLVVWDARDGHVLFKDPIVDGQSVWQVIFTPDSKRLVLSHLGTEPVEMLSTEAWATVTTTQLDPSVIGVDTLGFVGFSPDGSTILAIGGLFGGGDGSLIWLDAATLQITKTVVHVHTGSPKSTALSPDGSLIATGASDGILRVWDAQTGELKQQMDFGGSQVQGVAFIDDRHVDVALSDAGLLTMTVDPAELADVVRSSITRSFTATECTTYGIDPCPSLDQIRAP